MASFAIVLALQTLLYTRCLAVECTGGSACVVSDDETSLLQVYGSVNLRNRDDDETGQQQFPYPPPYGPYPPYGAYPAYPGPYAAYPSYWNNVWPGTFPGFTSPLEPGNPAAPDESESEDQDSKEQQSNEEKEQESDEDQSNQEPAEQAEPEEPAEVVVPGIAVVPPPAPVVELPLPDPALVPIPAPVVAPVMAPVPAIIATSEDGKKTQLEAQGSALSAKEELKEQLKIKELTIKNNVKASENASPEAKAAAKSQELDAIIALEEEKLRKLETEKQKQRQEAEVAQQSAEMASKAVKMVKMTSKAAKMTAKVSLKDKIKKERWLLNRGHTAAENKKAQKEAAMKRREALLKASDADDLTMLPYDIFTDVNMDCGSKKACTCSNQGAKVTQKTGLIQCQKQCLKNSDCLMIFCEHRFADLHKCNCHEYASCAKTRTPTNAGVHYKKELAAPIQLASSTAESEFQRDLAKVDREAKKELKKEAKKLSAKHTKAGKHQKKKVKKAEFTKTELTQCDEHVHGNAFTDIEEAKKACLKDDKCSGVYDNYCDGKTIQYGSHASGFFMCDADYALESSKKSCVYEKEVDLVEKIGNKAAVFKKSENKQCDDHDLGTPYNSMIKAQEACTQNPDCSGVYDNYCDGKTTQYGSSKAGFRMCNGEFTLEDSEKSCVYEKQLDLAEKMGGKAGQWTKAADKHCDETTIGKPYMTVEEATQVCADNDQCSGVYDNYCDGKAIQYGSKVKGFRLCDKAHMLDKSENGGCVYVKKGMLDEVSNPTYADNQAMKQYAKEALKDVMKDISAGNLGGGGGGAKEEVDDEVGDDDDEDEDGSPSAPAAPAKQVKPNETPEAAKLAAMKAKADAKFFNR